MIQRWARAGERRGTDTGTVVRFWTAAGLGVAFGYIEAAVVVYLRQLFHPGGFTFPLADFAASALYQRLLQVEAWREAATIVLIWCGARLAGVNRRERFAYFLLLFALWDLFFYVWLKVLLGWPGSVMDWDILFLIPMVWASPIAAPVLVSLTLAVFAVVILRRGRMGRGIRVRWTDWAGFCAAVVMMVLSFCIAGLHIRDADFAKHFYWPLYGAGYVLGVGLFLRCLVQRPKS